MPLFGLLLLMEKFNTIIAVIFKIPVQSVSDMLTSKDIPDWDSMNYLLCIAELEKQFGISFTMDEVLKADSVGSLKTALLSKGVIL